MRRLTWIGALAALLVLPATAFAIDLVSPDGFVFDIQDTSRGQILNGGTVDIYDSTYILEVDGTEYNVSGAASTTTLGGRQVEMAEVMIGSMAVQRLVYVPTGGTGRNYARFLDLIRNTGSSSAMVTVRIDGDLGSDFSTVITGSSSGDMTVDTADDWFTTDDSGDGTGDPSLGHVLQASGAAVRASSVSMTSDDLAWTFDVTIGPGETVGFLTFAIQEMDRAASIAEATRLSGLPGDALMGIETYAADIVNFPVGGAPIVRFTAPNEIDEGAETLVEIAVEDLEGDPTVTWSWDTDDDGTFGELPMADSYTIPMGSTDGDGIVRVGVETSDGTNTRQIYRSITVNNVAPEITSTPPATANVRREYTYTPTIDEPAEDNDPLRYILVSRPTGMEVDASTGTISWTPSTDQRARVFDVNLQIDDGDGGEDNQMWQIAVADNTPPEPPEPVSPIDRMRVPEGETITLTVENGSDPDGDELVYFFRVSQTSDFLNPDVVGSGELDEDPSGMTSWTTPEPLSRGLWYWEVWVDDGITESFHRFAQVVVGDVDMPEGDGGVTGDGGTGGGFDAGPGGGGGGDGGCSVSAAPAPRNAPWLLALAGLALLRRRIVR